MILNKCSYIIIKYSVIHIVTDSTPTKHGDHY